MSVNKFYHIVLLGNVGTLTVNQVSNCLYYFDWGLLPKSRWRVYTTANLGTFNYSSNQYCLINVDLGQNTDLAKNIYGSYNITTQSDKNIYISNFINPSNQGSTCVFQFGQHQVNSIYLDSTPTGSTIRQTLLNGGRTLFTPTVNISRIILSFEQLDDPIPRSIKTSYQVIFNSSLGVMNSIFGIYSFYYDWANIPQGEYLVNMSFTTNNIAVVDTKFSGNSIYIDLGQGNSTVFIPSNQANYDVSNKNFVGMTLFQGTNGLGQGAQFPLYSNSDTTKPLYLKSRPINNNVDVLILSDYKQQYPLDMTSTNDPLYNYTLVLTFNLIV